MEVEYTGQIGQKVLKFVVSDGLLPKKVGGPSLLVESDFSSIYASRSSMSFNRVLCIVRREAKRKGSAGVASNLIRSDSD